jgi:hypothetical protein
MAEVLIYTRFFLRPTLWRRVLQIWLSGIPGVWLLTRYGLLGFLNVKARRLLAGGAFEFLN